MSHEDHIDQTFMRQAGNRLSEELFEKLGDHPALRTFGKSQPRGGLGFGNHVIQGVHPARKVRFHKKNNAALPIRE